MTTSSQDLSTRNVGNAPYDQDLDWLINEAPGLLGESGISYNPNGGGQRIIVDSGPWHIERMKSIPAVQKAARLNVPWATLTPMHRRVLRGRYPERKYWPLGFDTQFSELAGVVMVISSRVEELKWATPQPKKYKRLIESELKEARMAHLRAHEAWIVAKREAAMWAECPGRLG